MAELTLDELGSGGDQPAESTYLDFYAELGPKTAADRAALIWRMPKDSAVTVNDNL
jgi:hypothetical protein